MIVDGVTLCSPMAFMAYGQVIKVSCYTFILEEKNKSRLSVQLYFVLFKVTSDFPHKKQLTVSKTDKDFQYFKI